MCVFFSLVLLNILCMLIFHMSLFRILNIFEITKKIGISCRAEHMLLCLYTRTEKTNAIRIMMCVCDDLRFQRS